MRLGESAVTVKRPGSNCTIDSEDIQGTEARFSSAPQALQRSSTVEPDPGALRALREVLAFRVQSRKKSLLLTYSA